ncbi:MAG: hypothetical protein A3G52_03360 [Candidatus Taylorbacteria bacterium RIFCSPLOWO2_12_FULL_43_20]|uniref:Glycosyl transferase family 1 domain-containing protein n=1 Tax=Candidatus Taylorbacteria bacterium RIFCSPLOWO2_12_FULL_43_20 TaxID=1802332 RepID=A0A1G2P0H4_9BACT|nr:MAG: hypothetical protein A2825_02305 [Candidatus Taylorbacteria bacterium RIFCSPHIGHO2_01_FULL_43_120]OHA22385.1 MAG: hypothetical protein A3B98_02205 [Candidatus Taylorbacteria bacterium RIFCSPHIGHO2_02_FULL_43_55]OHA41846.1 MAG: hypothetical protein A3G52_03360 [Candidatus Taylorbacteria bacterium RIFCSPLOWO2_12_FULL_43_20]
MMQSNKKTKNASDALKIISLSLDPKMGEEGSAVRERVRGYAENVDRFDTIYPSAVDIDEEENTRASFFGVAGGNKFTKALKIYLKASHLMKKKEYTVITVQDIHFLAFIAFVLSRSFGVGLEVQVHGIEKKNYFRNILAAFLFKHCNIIRIVSKRTRDELIDRFKIEQEKFIVVPIDPAFIPKNSSQNGPEFGSDIQKNIPSKKNSEKICFLTAGRLVPVKNISMQIKAFAKVSSDYKESSLLIAGDGKEMKKLQKLAKSLSLEKSVVFLGWRKDMTEFYEKADIFLFSSNSEGWGMAVVEACLFGLPVIMTRVGCADEFIIHEYNGLIVPVGDQEKMEEAMKRLIENFALRNTLARNARDSKQLLISKEETIRLYKLSWLKAANSCNLSKEGNILE